MGRELKRVPLDFAWELDTVWHGYVNYCYQKSYQCPQCNGSGLSAEAQKFNDLWYGYLPFKPEDNGVEPHKWDDDHIMALAERNTKDDVYYIQAISFQSRLKTNNEAKRLAAHFNSSWMHNLNQEDVDFLLADGKLKEYTHTFVSGKGWEEKPNVVIPTPKQLNQDFFDLSKSSYQWSLMRMKCEKLGVPYLCSKCEGESVLWHCKEDKEAYENWKRTEPPTGDGYQIWETVSEGSPISPVFASPEALATHMTTTRWGADEGSSYETWMNFITGPGWAPSGVQVGGESISGVEFLGRQ